MFKNSRPTTVEEDKTIDEFFQKKVRVLYIKDWDTPEEDEAWKDL